MAANPLGKPGATHGEVDELLHRVLVQVMAVIALRWLLFIPTAAVLIALAQVAVLSFAERIAWYISAPIIVFFGVVLAAAGMAPVQIAPDGKIGASVIITLFVLFEVVALLSFIPNSPPYLVITRQYVDLVIVLGAVAGASDRKLTPA